MLGNGFLLVACLPIALPSAVPQTCEPHWVPTFSAPGLNAESAAATVFDDGGGPVLVVGGEFNRAGGAAANRVASWDGATWAPFADGLSSTSAPGTIGVAALAVFDDGGGPELYAGGDFLSAGGVGASRIARWDGAAWTALGAGTNGDVHALASFDAGGGPQLYVGGAFILAGGVQRNHVARWNGASWSSVGAGMNAPVRCFAVFDDGSGPALYVGGDFSTAGGGAASRVARWNGTAWSAVGGGTNGTVLALEVFDDGSGAALYAGGAFTSAGGVSVNRIARWDGAEWAPLGDGLNDRASALKVLDDGGEARLIVGGSFTTAGGAAASRVASWDGASWSSLGAGTNGAVAALASYDAGGGSELFVMGAFTSAGGLPAKRIARWDGAWSMLDTGPDTSLTGGVLALADFGGSPDGPALHTGGSFPTGTSLDHVLRFQGSAWAPASVPEVNNTVHALQVFDDGSGSGAELFVAGDFNSAGGDPALALAKWDGTSWSALGTGLAGSFIASTAVYSLAVFDDGTGPGLYAGGNFTMAGGTVARGIARWDGSAWSRLRLGLAGEVYDMAVFDDGNGSALYVGGAFVTTGGGVAMNYIARWDGNAWSAVGGGMSSFVTALEVFDDGSGPALYAGGWFTSAGGVPANHVARWNGSSWAPLGSGMDLSWSGADPSVEVLEVFDDGSGPALYAGGFFDLAGGLPAKFIARWDGFDWAPLGGGVNNTVRALLVQDLPEGRALLVGGDFSTAWDSRDAYLARWQGCLDVVGPTIDAPPAVFARERGSVPGEVVTFSVSASDVLDAAPTLSVVPPSGSLFPPGPTTVTCTATDAAGNQSIETFEVFVGLKPVRNADR